MIAKFLIEPNLPTIQLTDTGEHALSLMNEFKVSHLPLVDNKKFLGLISVNDILVDKSLKFSDYKKLFVLIYTKEKHHIYEVIKMMSQNSLSLIPVLNKKDEYCGSISLLSLTQQFSKLASLENSGGIIILELNTNDYSMAEIARITEANGVKIVSSYVTTHSDSTKIELTLKFNETDLTRIIKAFNRFEYIIKASFHESEFIDELKNRYDNFMHYLNI